MKLYVKETTTKNGDGDYMTKVEVFKSKPHFYSYVIWA